jgi:cyclase
MRRDVLVVCLVAVLLNSLGLQAASTPEEVKVTEVAPGVFFRKAQTLPVFTGCNQGWVVFKDYVLIIDANFPGQAEEVIKTIKQHTDKPIRFVFDTHYHGDHADGNMQYSKIGATVVAHERSQPLFQTKGSAAFEDAKTDRAEEYGKLSYELPSLYFTHKLIFDDGDQRVELIFFGHAHTAGDAVAYLPKHGILFTGDACVNGAFNYTGDSDTASWITALNAMQELNVKMVCPGHGESGGREVLENQQKYYVELRKSVQGFIDEGKSLDEIKKEISIPFFTEWAGVEVTTRTENIEHVYTELTAAKPPLDKAKAFKQWQKLPGKGQYAQLGEWERLGECEQDARYDALADMFLMEDSGTKNQLREYFGQHRDELVEMWIYVRRAAVRMRAENASLLLRRALAIAAIEGGRDDYRDTIVSLVLLRFAAEKQAVAVDAYFKQIEEHVATENRPLFENARTHAPTDIVTTVQAFGPPGWADE